MHPASRSVACALAVAVTAVATWLASGVGALDVVLLLGYQAAFVLLPGVGLHRLLVRDATALERLAVGWATGYAVAIAAFHLTSALDLRGLYSGVPLLALLLLARRPSIAPATLSGAAVAGLGAIAALAIVFQALAFVPLAPLPGTSSAAYPPDPMFHLAVAAEALHHFPVTDPKVSGTPLPYHVFAHYEIAATAEVTGIELPVVALRLAAVPLLVLGTLVIGLLASRAGARGVGVALAPAVFLFVGEIDLQPRIGYPFWGGAFFGLTFSPSFLLAVPLFGALLAVVLRLLAAPSRGLWGLAALLAWAVGGAKGGSLAVLVGGTLLFAVVRRDRRALAVASLGAAVAAAQLVVVYGGAGEGNLSFRLLGAVRSSSAVDALANWLAVIGPLGTLGAIAFGVVALLVAPALAAAWAPRDGPAWALLASVFAVGLVPLLLLTHRGESQLYLTQLGLIGATALAGVGLERLLAHASKRTAILALGWLGALVALAYLPSLAGAEGTDAHAIWYGGLVALAALVPVAARRAEALVLVAVLAAAVNVPLDTIAPLARAHADGTPLSEGDDVTAELYDGLTWIRDNTSADAVLAVNVHDTNRGRFDNFVHSALAERRVFLEGWLYSILTRETTPREVARGLEQPFPERKRLNDAVFAGDRDAAAMLARDHGVRYLFVDKLHGEALAEQLGPVVFSNAAVDVVALE